jgi:asparaginyl-tRNA synthetase
MCDKIQIRELSKHIGERVNIPGWLYNMRSSGKIIFLILRDGTGLTQCVAVKGEVNDALFDKINTLTQESSIIVSGTVREDKRSPGGFEVTINDLEVIQIAEEYPIALKEHGVGFLSELRHLWIRSPKQNSILRIRAQVISGIMEYLNNEGFVSIDSPILTGSAPEGTTSLFEIDYFDQKAYLTQSGQLYEEAAAMAFGRVYSFGPTFRAEKSKTRRHLTEFWMIEPEMSFCDLNESMIIQENLIASVIKRCLDKCDLELTTLERDKNILEKIKTPFPRLKYADIIELLNKKGREKNWGDDITGLDETIISDEFDSPVFITHLPLMSAPFYMKTDPDNPKVVLASDLIAPEGYGEIIGGSQRIDDLETLKQKIKEFGLSEEDYKWYIDLRRYGSVPHSGFGLGLERLVAWITGIDHIRETIPFPRTIERIYP